jgi:molybdopterin synthase catalytic subunit
MWVDVRDTPLSIDEVVDRVRRTDAGGIDVFVGVVRDNVEGRPVTLLEYEAYRPMALAEMGRIATEVELRIADARVAAAHRLGAMNVGDVVVVCAASAPHRAEAFEACRALIEEIKHRVPIWKREHGPDGAYWVGWIDARCGHGHDT